MKIVVLDGYTENPGDLSWDALRELGEVTVYDRTSYEESPLIAERIGDAEIVVINKTPISKETIDKCGNIKLIAVLATGYNVVDYTYAKEKGIPVVNVPTYGTQIVGQYALGLLLEICSHYGHHDETVKAGKWENNEDWCYWDYPMIELYGKTAGIIGLGRIGQATAKLLNALDMKVLAYDTFQSDAGKKLAEYVTLDELFARSDVIFLHCPLFPETGSGRRLKQRKSLRSRTGCGFHRTYQRGQSSSESEKLYYHSAHFLGCPGLQTEDYGYYSRECSFLP